MMSSPTRLLLFHLFASLIYLTRVLSLMVVHIPSDLLQAIIRLFFLLFLFLVSVPAGVVGLTRLSGPNMP